MRTMQDLITDMHELADAKTGDPEKWHPEADALLVEAVLGFAQDIDADAYEEACVLIDAYKRVGKWYA